MKLQAQFCLLRLVFFLFYCSLCEPKQLTGYEFPVYTTNMCPRDETEWSQRSSSINCTKSNSYICIPNENRTELLEFCYIYPTTWINKGVCLYLIKRYSRVDSYKCNTFEYGCPDIAYKATQLIHYKSCVSIGNGCFLAEPLCKKEWRDDTTDYEQTTQNIDIDIYRVKDYAIEVLLGTVISILLILFLIIVYVCCRRGKFSKCWKNADVEDRNCENQPVESNDEELRFDQWREDGVSFVSTRACKKVDSKIKTQNLVIVTGHSGSGKSAIIQHIALKYMDQKWIVKLFKDVRKMIKYILEQECSMKSTILVLNDPIGKDSFDKAAYLSWKESEQAILTFLEKGKLICSCRNYILFDNKVKGVLKNKTNIVNIEDVECKLTNEEKRCIWNNYITNANISEEDFDKILNIEAYFPLLCKLFSGGIKYQKDGYRFFKEPVEVVEEQIRYFRKEDREKYCALVLLVLFNNFCADDVVRNDLLGNNFKRALMMCGLSQDTPPYNIVDNLDLLNGFLVQKIGDAYEFNHDFIMEVTSFIFGKDYPSGFIQYADIRFLLRRVTLDNGIEQNRQFTIYLSDTNIDIFGERLFKAIFEECYIQVILHPALRDKRLINVLQKEFERHPKKLQELLQNKKSMHDDQKLYWPITDDTVSKLALVALENEFSPLCALVAFCHTDLSLYCFNALRKSKSGLNRKNLVPAVCLHGSRDFLKMFPDNYVKHSLKETFRNLFPIHITALFYNFEILQKLIELGADVNMNSKDEKSWTPLIFAASRDKNDPQENDYNMETSIRRDKTVQILIKYKADVNLCTGDGVSSLFLACQNGHTSMVEILLSSGAYINQCTNNGESPLFIACQEGHNDIVQFLLEKEADINLRTAEDEISPLYIACENGHERTVQTLLDHDADVNSCTITGASPLFIACQKGYDSSVQLLIRKGAAVNMCLKNGASPLYKAFQKDHISTVKLLLSNGADKTSPLFKACENGNEKLVQLLLDNEADINIRKEDGTSPLFIACQNGYHEIVQLLVNNSANIDSCTLDGFSPLVIACLNGYEETVRTLLNHGADVNLCTITGVSPLAIACQNGYNSSVQLLIGKGADVNMCEKNGASPLYIACEIDHISTVKLLLRNRADVNLCRKDKTSPLFIACYNGNEKMVKLLLDNGADINICKEDGSSPLFIACRNGYHEIVQLLLTNGAKVNLCILDGFSPLAIACLNGHEENVRTLLKHGADVNLCTITGASPLYIACQRGYNSSVQLLIGKGAVVNMCMKNGASPLGTACQKNHISTVKLLLSNGADVNLCRKDKSSPLFIAYHNGNEKMVQLLLDNGADINICDEDGVSSLFLAYQNECHETVQLLQKNL